LCYCTFWIITNRLLVQVHTTLHPTDEISVLLDRVIPPEFQDPQLLYYWGDPAGVHRHLVMEGSDTMYSLCMPSGAVLVVEEIPRYYIHDFPLNGDSDDESDTPFFGGCDEFVEFLEESDDVAVSFRDHHDHPIHNV
jgi:hypothetical protein